MIISLAGHVDHGKTSLVNAITGVMTDRLAEETARGLTIDLGFAYLQQDQQTLGFVDVPGHHRFIHNMVAGVSSQQCALLVIAADDGPMPQTREHLNIMQVLGLQQGVVVITKTDRVSADRVSELQVIIRDFLQGTFLANAPIVSVSSETKDGISDLVELLWQQQQATHQNNQKSARLAIDRAFNLKGLGLVVTGTLHCGTINEGDELFLFPSGERVRVRSLHVQDAPAQQANSGDRCALNVTGAALDQVTRGCWLMTNAPTQHHTLVAHMDILADYPRPLKHWTAVHAYHGTSHSVAQMALLEGNVVNPGSGALVELNCEAPLNAKRGDRLVLRDYGQDSTIGGAVILDNAQWTGRRRAPTRLRQLNSEQDSSAEHHFATALTNGGVRLAEFAQLWDLPSASIDALLAANECQVQQDFAVTKRQIETWAEQVLSSIAAHESTGGPALRRNELQDQQQSLSEMALTLALDTLVTSKRLQSKDGRYQTQAHKEPLSVKEQGLLDLLQAQLDSDQPPSLGDISKRSGRALDEIKRGIKPLAAKGYLALAGDSRAFLPERFATLVALASELQTFTVREFRDASGLGRNVVIDVLETMDAKGYTRRDGDKRKVVGQWRS